MLELPRKFCWLRLSAHQYFDFLRLQHPNAFCTPVEQLTYRQYCLVRVVVFARCFVPIYYFYYLITIILIHQYWGGNNCWIRKVQLTQSTKKNIAVHHLTCHNLIEPIRYLIWITCWLYWFFHIIWNNWRNLYITWWYEIFVVFCGHFGDVIFRGTLWGDLLDDKCAMVVEKQRDQKSKKLHHGFILLNFKRWRIRLGQMDNFVSVSGRLLFCWILQLFLFQLKFIKRPKFQGKSKKC